mgnify:CR=1 FL=1
MTLFLLHTSPEVWVCLSPPNVNAFTWLSLGQVVRAKSEVRLATCSSPTLKLTYTPSVPLNPPPNFFQDKQKLSSMSESKQHQNAQRIHNPPLSLRVDVAIRTTPVVGPHTQRQPVFTPPPPHSKPCPSPTARHPEAPGPTGFAPCPTRTLHA